MRAVVTTACDEVEQRSREAAASFLGRDAWDAKPADA